MGDEIRSLESLPVVVAVSIVMAVVVLVIVFLLVRWLVPKLVDAATANTERICESFDRAVTRIVEDNQKSRETFGEIIDKLREESNLQRQHDQAMRESAWRHIQELAARFDQVVDSLRQVVDSVKREHEITRSTFKDFQSGKD